MLAVRAALVAVPRGAVAAGVACGVARAVETPGAGAGAGSDSCVACEAQPATRARDSAVRLAVRVVFMLISPSGYVLPDYVPNNICTNMNKLTSGKRLSRKRVSERR